MYANCLGIYNQEDVEKAIRLLKENNIEFNAADPLTLFEENEAEYRLTEMHTVVDKNGKTVEITDELIADVANVLGGGEYFDYDYMDDLIQRELELNQLSLKHFSNMNGYNVTKNISECLEIGDLVIFPHGAGDDIELAQWLDKNSEPYKVTRINEDEQRCWVEGCLYDIPFSKIALFQNIGF